MKKIKIFTTFIVAISAMSPFTIVTSCSNGNKYSSIAEQLKETAIKEFLEIAKIPRPSGHTEKIREYLIKRIKELGFEPKTDLDSTKSYDPANVWFDIPATKGYENYPKIVLQGHMDMVVAGLSEQEQTEVGIEPVRENITKDGKTFDVIHSKNYETSLGADNGIGIGTIFAIAQNKNIKHGPIRCLITADEESDMGGAKKVLAEKETLNVIDTNYILNIDAEVDCGLFISCQGNVNSTYNTTLDLANIDTTFNQYDLYVSGFRGGHSGEDVAKQLGSADRFTYELLNLIKNDGKKDIQIIGNDHYDINTGTEPDWKRNSFITNNHVQIATNANMLEIQAYANILFNDYEVRFPGDKLAGKTPTMVIRPIQDKVEKGLGKDDSEKVIKLLGSEEGLMYGIHSWREDKPTVVETSANIGPVKIYKENDKITFNLQTCSRSIDDSDVNAFGGRSGASPDIEANKETWKKIMGTYDGYTEDLYILGWKSSTDNPMQKLAVEGYKQAGKETNLYDSGGFIELTVFRDINPGKMQMISIGPRLEDCHTVTETLYLDTLNSEYEAICYMLENINKVTQ